MSHLALFVIAAALVLVTPGPTNALLATSAALVGFRRSLPLIIMESAGYGVAISVLMIASRPFVAVFPQFGLALRAILVIYLLWLAWRLWHAGTASRECNAHVITNGRVFFTTVLNPKATIFAFVIFPPLDGLAQTIQFAGAFALTTAVVATGWMAFGATVGCFAGPGRRLLLPRATAVCLFVLACGIAGSVIAVFEDFSPPFARPFSARPL